MSYVPSGHLPDGHLPSGHLPEADSTPPSDYPDVAASRSIRLPAGGIWVVDPDVPSWCEVIWIDVLPTGVTLASVAWTLPGVLVSDDEAIDLTLGKSAIQISGVTHSMLAHIAAVATLSNGATISFTPPLRGFNG